MRIPGIPYVQGKNSYSDGDGRKYGIAIHNTSNDASDSGEASYATWRPDGTSSHFYADGDSVTQSLDTAAKAGHAGSYEGNEHAISVEITGGNGKSRAWWLANVAWDKLGQVLAVVIRHHWPDGSFQVRRASVAEMKANPKIRALYGHDDMRRAWGGTTHTDPGPNFPWDRLISAINTALGGDWFDMATKAELAEVVRAELRGWYEADPQSTKDAPLPDRRVGGDIRMMELRHGQREDRAIARDQAQTAAVLAAFQGLDTAAIVAKLDELAAEERTRDEAAATERAELRAELLALVASAVSGELAAAEVVRLIGERLTAGEG